MNSADPPLRVLLACDNFVRYTADLAGGLRENGAEVALLTRDHDMEFGGEEGAFRSFVTDRVDERIARYELPGRFRSPQGLQRALRIRRELREFSPDVIHVQAGITNDPRLLLAANARPGRFAFTLHDPSPHPGDRVTVRERLMVTLLIRTAGLIFMHGEALREDLLSTRRVNAPVVVLPHGVTPAVSTPAPSNGSLLFFGRMSEYKGLDVLLDCLPKLWERLPAATLTVAGSGVIPTHSALDDSRVRVRRGHVPDRELESLFTDSGCVVLPYREASQSGVGSLAKQYARPLVVTSVGGLPELVADGSGLIVPPGDPSRLAEALASVLTDPDLARRLGEAGARTAAGPASWKHVAALTLEAYRERMATANLA
ncbi:MAG TPA: glycosyltransferase family 4 protein [Solirubrobacterales bacterium]|nr:glycosyltransferase family 4 protein [Solirubrobacterales bacterium]